MNIDSSQPLNLLNNVDKKKEMEKTKLKFKSNYFNVAINMLFMALLIIGSINWSLTVFNYNLVESINNFFNNIFKMNLPINKIIYIILGLIALYIASKRDTWLPFLGDTVIPDILIPLKIPPHFTKTIIIKTEPNCKIVYWSAMPHKEILDVYDAYEDYSNSGCVLSNNLGEAKLFIIEGTPYSVPFNSNIPKHVHYRIFNNSNNILGKVNTIYY